MSKHRRSGSPHAAADERRRGRAARRAGEDGQRPRAAPPSPASTRPPLDCIISGSGQAARARSARAGAAGSAPSSGEREASITVVEARSYSRNVPTTSCESETWTSAPSRSRSAARDRALVRRVAPGEQQADRDRLRRRAARARPRRAAAASASSGSQHAARADPLGGAEAQLRRRERRRARGAQAVELRPVLAGELEEVGEALGRDERRARAVALEQRVRRDGHPVGERADVAPARRPRRSQDRRDRREHAARLVVRASSAPWP